MLYFVNNLLKCEVGDDLVFEEIDYLVCECVIGLYEKLNWDGWCMCCVSNVLFDDEGWVVGMMCINFNIVVFDEVCVMFDFFIKGVGVVV